MHSPAPLRRRETARVGRDRRPRTREACSAPIALELTPVLRRVLETGEPLLIPKIDLEAFKTSLTPEYYAFARDTAQHSAVVVALRLGDRSLGQMTLTRYGAESPPFDDDDLALAAALADHAAVAIANSHAYAAEREARVAAEQATVLLRASESRHRQMFDKSPLPKYMYDLETLRFVAVNDAAIRDYGYSRDEFPAMSAVDLRPPDDRAAALAKLRGNDLSPRDGVYRHSKKSGEIILAELTTHTFVDGERRYRIVVASNVTERVRLEEQLRQSQKMEAVGKLAGGIAHDFNNVLSVVLAHSELLLADLAPAEPMRESVQEIHDAGTRASALTRQLLMFSRQQVVEPKVVDLNDVLRAMDKMLLRILGADVDLISLPGSGLGRVRVDRSSIEQVIMNLVVNARDAMPTGGRLTIETANVVIDGDYVKSHFDAVPGPHVMLAVTDTGVGMDRATVTHIFEPFFTTKPPDRGTGLGLSTVFGIVKQSGGNIWVYSEPGKGTTFKIYLPRVDAAADEVTSIQPPDTLRGAETILLVEDDDAVRSVARTILRRQGYVVLDARNAGEALLLSESHKGEFHLLLSDVVMPQLSGPELAKRLAVTRPEMKVLCMSGYTDDSIVRHGVLRAQLAFLQKPFTSESLLKRVREVLDAPPGRPPSNPPS